jgi:3-oxoacyl-[acyl-carrier-protein] synthase-1
LQPFDQQRQGTVFGEGAAAFVLERAEDVKSRGARALGELLGSGCTTEATGILDLRPDGDGVSRAIQVALKEADLPPDAVGMIVAHGNGTRASDASEAAAIARVFGDHPPPVTAFKWAFGHTIAASGTLDLALALLSLEKKTVPGIATLSAIDPALKALPVSSKARQPRSDVALVLCRGFGGMNVALLARGGTATP